MSGVAFAEDVFNAISPNITPDAETGIGKWTDAQIIAAIREVCAGGVYLSPSVSGAVVQAYLAKSEAPYDPLTDRERQVLQLVAEGNTTKEIAMILGVAAKTAETHRVKVMDKLDIHSTAGLVRYAIRRGLIQV